MINRIWTLILTAAVLAMAVSGFAQDDVIKIMKPADFLGGTPPTPITIQGFSGEVAAALSFDLTVMGFTNVPAGSANFVLSGSNEGSVKGTLTAGGLGTVNVNGSRGTTTGKTVLFSKQYQGSTMRTQAHMLADDVVLKLTGIPGIAEKNGQISRIAFKADAGKTSEIYVSDFDGHDFTPATKDGSIVAAPAWRPGGAGIFYTSYKLGNPNIFYQTVSTGKRDNFSHYNGMNSSAAVSPDGTKVAMILGKGGSPDVWVCNIDGSGLKRLTATREDESSPCWSPDSKWICFASKGDERRALSKVSPDGGPAQRIPISGVSNPSEPDWSPDGKYIVFTSQMGGFEICVVPAQGGPATVLVAGEDPCWAPNSRTVIFVQRRNDGRGLSLLDVPTKQVKSVSRVPGSSSSNSQPSWAK